MLKVMILDDEILAVEYIRELIDWEAHGYSIVSETTSPHMALKLFNKHKPHIIITDIRMPGMDGLAFCRKILECDSNTKIILLTAYNDFKYAKKAIELGVQGYILKHEINSETLLDNLDKLKTKIEEEHRAAKIVNRYNILSPDKDCNDAGNSAIWQMSDDCSFVMILMRPDQPIPILKQQQYLSDRFIDNLPESFEIDLPETICHVDTFKTRSHDIVFLFSVSNELSEEEIIRKIQPVALKVKNQIEKLTSYKFIAVIDCAAQSLKNISLLYQSCKQKLRFRMFWNKGEIISALRFDTVSQVGINKEEISRRLHDLEKSLYQMDYAAVSSTIDDLFSNYIQLSKDEVLLINCCNELTLMINTWCELKQLPSLRANNNCAMERLCNCYSVNDIKKAFKDIFYEYSQYRFDKNFDSYSPRVQQAINYLYQHYNKPISIWNVASALEITDSYLSRVFKNETGHTLLNYLTLLRINKSKKLLACTNFKIYEIAERVGFGTSQYFSQVFFKITGMTPADFRKIEQKGQLDKNALIIA